MHINFNMHLENVKAKMHNVFSHIGEMGKALIAADNELGGPDFDLVKAVLLNHGFSQSFINGAMKVARGELDGRLFMVCEQHGAGLASKLMSLSGSDQNRILSGEHFELLQEDGGVVSKPMRDMTRAELLQLLGPKGGEIRAACDQEVKDPTEHEEPPIVFKFAKYSGKILTLKGGKKSGKIQLGALVDRLDKEDALDTFVKDLREIQRQRNVTMV